MRDLSEAEMDILLACQNAKDSGSRHWIARGQGIALFQLKSAGLVTGDKTAGYITTQAGEDAILSGQIDAQPAPRKPKGGIAAGMGVCPSPLAAVAHSAAVAERASPDNGDTPPVEANGHSSAASVSHCSISCPRARVLEIVAERYPSVRKLLEAVTCFEEETRG